jgi:predicted nucleotidyltransferase component of viral defense system
MRINPRLEILSDAQKELLPLLKEVPDYFVLYGGTAVALRYGHRQSEDFDFFTTRQGVDLVEVGRKLPCMKRFEISGDLHFLKRNVNQVDFTLILKNDIVKISFINNLDLIAGAVNSPDIMSINYVNIASPIDLMAAKILALHNRTQAKDYFDLSELIMQGVSLQNGYESAYAIAKISRLGTSQLMLDRLNSEFQSSSVEKIVSKSDLSIISSQAQKCGEVLKAAAREVKLERVEKTTVRACPSLEKGKSRGR